MRLDHLIESASGLPRIARRLELEAAIHSGLESLFGPRDPIVLESGGHNRHPPKLSTILSHSCQGKMGRTPLG